MVNCLQFKTAQWQQCISIHRVSQLHSSPLYGDACASHFLFCAYVWVVVYRGRLYAQEQTLKLTVRILHFSLLAIRDSTVQS